MSDYLSALASALQGASNSAASTVSGPVDGISWLMRKAGLGGVIGPAPMGGSQWMAQQGLTAPPSNPTAGLVGEALGGITPIGVAAKASKLASVLLKGSENLAAPASAANLQRGAVVYHGSPHTFDAFDMSKIGTGEGAQAYGHGLYFADEPSVAQSYQTAISQKQGAGPGNLYQVDLPDEHIAQMMNWDAPLAQQPAQVQRLARGLGISDATNGEDLMWKLKRSNFDVMQSMNSNKSAANAYASSLLSQAGVPGIRYLDDFSRAAGKGTSNYVVFDDQLPQIMQRNGQAPQ